MAYVLEKYQHLVRYAHWAYMNDDGAEFRSVADDLDGEARFRKLDIVTPFLGRRLRLFTPNTHVHLGIRNGDTLVLAFRGTDFPFTIENLVSPKRWWGFVGNVWTDFAFGMAQIRWPVRRRLPPSVLVHEGFLAAFDNLLVENRLGCTIIALLNGRHPAKIEVCGHSMGGALAILCALWCRAIWDRASITCVTLGSPRVGNGAFARYFLSNDILCYRVVMSGDPIPTLPDRYTEELPIKLPRQTPGPEVAVARYQHVGTPILIREVGAGSGKYAVICGAETPDVEAEEQAPDLSRIVKLPYKMGGFLAYWAIRGMRMMPGIWWCHDPCWYETVVQRIMERERARNKDH